MIFVSTIGFSGMRDLVVWSEITLGHCIVGKIQDGRHMAKSKHQIDIIFHCRCMISVSTVRFSGMPDLVVWSEIILDVALWVKSKMAAFCQRSNSKSISFLTQ